MVGPIKMSKVESGVTYLETKRQGGRVPLAAVEGMLEQNGWVHRTVGVGTMHSPHVEPAREKVWERCFLGSSLAKLLVPLASYVG